MASFVAVYLIWGSTYLAIRIALGGLPPLLLCALRQGSAGVIMLVWARARGDAWPRAGVEWRNAAAVGLLLLGVGNATVTVGEMRVASGLVALIVAAVPLWMALFAAAGPRGVPPGPRAVAGLLVGFGGIALLIGPGLAVEAHRTASLWALIPLAGTVSWAWGSLWSRRARLPASPVMSTAIGLLAAGAALAGVSAATGEWRGFAPAHAGVAALAALAYLSVFGSVVAFSAYLHLLRRVPPAKAATYAFVNPVVALALGAWFGGEAFSPRALVAAALVIASVALTIGARAPAAPAEA